MYTQFLSTPQFITHKNSHLIIYRILAISSGVVSIMENGVESRKVGEKLIVYDKSNWDPKYTIFRGSTGTHVFLGFFEEIKKVAVKRVQREFLPSDLFEDLKKEAKFLLELAGHPNILQYYCTEINEDFM